MKKAIATTGTDHAAGAVEKTGAGDKPTTGTAQRDRAAAKIVQFNWRRHWSKKVAPHLCKEEVQVALDLGMSLLDPGWCRGDAPHVLGRISLDGTRVVNGKLTWYQVLGRCHWIAFFSMAVGVLNYPDLDWRFVSGDLHTVPVGYGQDGEPKAVMDILLFDRMSGEESIAHARKKLDGESNGGGLNEEFKFFVKTWVPRIRSAALGVGAAVDQRRRVGQ